MKVVELYNKIEDMANLIQIGIERKFENKDYYRGYLAAANHLVELLFFMEDIRDYRIKPFDDDQEAEKYAYDETWIATDFEVGLSKLYKQWNPDMEEVVEGKEYNSHIVPYGYLEFNNRIYPVFCDDAGQCDYIRLNGENFSGGAYNAYPEEEFISHIMYYELLQKVSKLIKEN